MEHTELLNINAKDFQLTIERVEEIKIPFIPLADEYKTFIPEISKVLEESKKNITEELVKRAKRVKLDIAKIRTSTKKVKDTEKAGVLQIGNAIQKCHNLIVDVVSEKEEELDKIVKHFENLEIERIKELRLERISLLVPFEVLNIESIALGEMEESVFNAFLKNAKNEYEEKIEKQKAEDERIKKEKEDNERIRLENEKLKKEVEENKKREFRESTPIIKDVKLEDNTERDKKEKEYITYRDSLNFDKFEKEEGKIVFYKKVGEFNI